MTKEFYCPCCSNRADQLTEGYCLGCFQDRQLQLEMHNAEYAFWNSLSDKEKDAKILWSVR